MKKYTIVVLFVLIGAILLTGCTSNKVKDEDPQISQGEDKDNRSKEEETKEPQAQLAPNFTLENLEGDQVSLEDYRGKIVLLNFWASWCTWCDKEMPDLQRLSEENEDIVIVAVNSMEDKSTVKDYIEKNQLTFDVLLDEDGEVSMTYLISGLPNTYFIDEEGYLLGRSPGYMEYDQMVRILESIRKSKEE